MRTSSEPLGSARGDRLGDSEGDIGGASDVGTRGDIALSGTGALARGCTKGPEFDPEGILSGETARGVRDGFAAGDEVE